MVVSTHIFLILQKYLLNPQPAFMGSQVKLNNKPIVTCSEQDNRPTLNTSKYVKKLLFNLLSDISLP